MRMHMTIWLTTTLAIVLAAASATFAATTAIDPQLWRQNCATLQQRFADAPVAAVTYTPLPAAPDHIAPHWQLTWQGLSLALPVLDYNHIAIANNGATVILATADGYGVFTGRPAGFDLAAAQKQPLLQTVWGQQITLGQVTAHGYTLTPAAISCDDENLRTQVRNAMAMTLKTVASPAPVRAAHRIPGWTLGLLTHGRGIPGEQRNSVSSYKYLLQNDFDNAPYTVEYRLPRDNAALSATALLLATQTAATDAPEPQWLRRLQAYLDKPSRATRCSLVEALQHADFDAQNVAQIAARESACSGSTRQ